MANEQGDPGTSRGGETLRDENRTSQRGGAAERKIRAEEQSQAEKQSQKDRGDGRASEGENRDGDSR